MATPKARSCLRSSATRLPCASNKLSSAGRSFSASPVHHYDEAREAEKWKKITLAGISTCAVLSIYNLIKGHHEFPDPPPYPYLHILNKEFPWGPEPLFEHIKKKKQQQSKH